MPVDQETIILLPLNKDKPIFRVIIAGGRSFKDYDLLKRTCDTLLITKRIYYTIIVVSGCQVSQDEEGNKWGADYLGEQYAKENGFEVEPYPADWVKFGRGAGIIRNGEMAFLSQALIAFWDGHSKGTKNMINLAKGFEKLVHIEYYNQ